MLAVDELARRAAADDELSVLARGWTALVQVRAGNAAVDIRFEEGEVTAVDAAGASGGSPDLRVEADRDAWDELWAEDHRAAESFSGAVLSGGLTITPSLERPEVFRHNGALQRLLALVAGAGAGEADAPADAGGAVVSRYVTVADDGVPYRILVQESGSGDPVLFLHPGGGDSRFWSHALADAGLQSRFRLLAIDLPYHGRSLPPTEGPGWWQRRYALDADQAGRWVEGACEALGLERPLLVGLGSGGQLVVHLLGTSAGRFRGGIAVNASSPTAAGNADFAVEALFHPRVSRRAGGAWIAGFMPAAVPAARRHEAEWIFASAGPSVLRGDTEFFQSDFDLAAAVARVRAPLVQAVGERHPGVGEGAAHVLAGVGYLAPLEDPPGFNRAIAELISATLDTEMNGR